MVRVSRQVRKRARAATSRRLDRLVRKRRVRRAFEVLEEVQDGLTVEPRVGEPKHVSRVGEHHLAGVREALAQLPGGLFADESIVCGGDQQRGGVDLGELIAYVEGD